MHEGKVVFNLGVSVQGDVVITAYHMRSHALQAKVRTGHQRRIQFWPVVLGGNIVQQTHWLVQFSRQLFTNQHLLTKPNQEFSTAMV